MGFAEPSLKLLTVDDEEEITKLVRLYFSKRGYDVLEAHNGEEAIKIIEENPDLDVILLDVMLPDTNGIEILEQVRPYLQNTVIIMVTGVNDLETVVNAMKLGADDYAVKPFRFGDLEAKIESALNKKSLREIKEGMTAKEAMEKLKQFKDGNVVITFTFDDIEELNKFTEMAKNTGKVDILDVRVGDEYEVSLKLK